MRMTLCFKGSAQEFVEARILGGCLKNDEFGLGDRHALSLEQQIAEILVATPPSKKGFDVAVDGFHHSKAYLGAAVVEDAVEVIQQHVGEFLKRYQPLPSQLIDPALQVAQHGSFIAVGPQPLQAFLQNLSFHHPPIEGELNRSQRLPFTTPAHAPTFAEELRSAHFIDGLIGML